MAAKYRINDLPDHTVQGIHEAHLRCEVATDDVLDDVIVRSAQQLAKKGYWMRIFMSATEEASLWRDLSGEYWLVDPDDGYVWEGARHRRDGRRWPLKACGPAPNGLVSPVWERTSRRPAAGALPWRRPPRSWASPSRLCEAASNGEPLSTSGILARSTSG
jgi:hypothetical protein